MSQSLISSATGEGDRCP